MSILPKRTYRFKIPAGFFAEIDKEILKIIWKHTKKQTARTILTKKNKVGRLTLPILKLTKLHTVIKPVWYWHKNKQRPTEQRFQKQNLLFMVNWFSTGVPRHFYGNRIVFLNERCWDNWISLYAKKWCWTPPPFLRPYTKIKSKWIKDLK